MTKFSTFILSLLVGTTCFAQGPYAPAAGKTGSTAIFKDSSLIKSWATGIEVNRGFVKISDPALEHNGSNRTSFGKPGYALGKAQDSTFHSVSLGDGGAATLTFERNIKNGPGPDFAVFENSFSDTYLELAFVEVSSDGKRFVRFPAVSLTNTATQTGGFASTDPTNIYNLAGKYRIAYGTPFDLEDIKDSAGIDLNKIRFVRVKDVVGSVDKAYASYDSKGNIINDPWPTAFYSGGFDLDAVGAINTGTINQIATFDELSLAKDSFWNGKDKSGGFSSGKAFLKNSYNADYGSWSGFAYSNKQDDTTAGYGNQYSSITAGGMNAQNAGNYVVAYYSSFDENAISFNNEAVIVNGFYVTNSTYAYFSMKNGDAFSKKFGGATGNDPDYFKLQIWGEKADSTFTDTVDFYLADFRSTNNENDYILDSWKWVDLESLGAIRKIHFSMSSTDNGDWGMNTPSFFCLDNLSVQIDETVSTPIVKNKSIKVYPNPFISSISIENSINTQVWIYDVEGHLLLQKKIQNANESIDLNSLTKGVYILKLQGEHGVNVEKIIKK